jgi:hypothetical protein
MGSFPNSHNMFGTRKPDPTCEIPHLEDNPELAVAFVRLSESQNKIDAAQAELAELLKSFEAQDARLNAISWGLDQMSERLKLLGEDDFVTEVETEMDHRIPAHIKSELNNKTKTKMGGR